MSQANHQNRQIQVTTLANFLSAHVYTLTYRKGRDNVNADFLSRLPLSPLQDDLSGCYKRIEPNVLGVYFIRACGHTSPTNPLPGVGLGGLIPPATSVSGGLPLTDEDFRDPRSRSIGLYYYPDDPSGLHLPNASS